MTAIMPMDDLTCAPKIRRARGRLKGGSPSRRQPDQPAVRLAA